MRNVKSQMSKVRDIFMVLSSLLTMTLINLSLRAIAKQSIALSIILILLFFNSGIAHDIVPGKPQKQPIALTGATIHIVSNGNIENGVIIFDKGKITAVGGNEITLPQNAKVIDISGKHVYPGLISPASWLGLIEIGAVRATKDVTESGDINPSAKAAVAYNPDSEVIPTVRSNGVTSALIFPKGRLISGTSSLVMLDGWTIEDAELKGSVGVHIEWPNMRVDTFMKTEKQIKEAAKKNKKELQKLEKAFSEARQYWLARNNKNRKIDFRWEAMLPVFDQKTPLIIKANEYKQIESAISFCQKENVKMVLFGGADSWRLTALLKKYNIPVILRPVHSLPTRQDDDYDLPYKLPSLLHQAGVKFCLSNSGNSFHTKDLNLPFQAATSVAFGLDKNIALRSLTLSTAEILGVDKLVGSLEVGKDATLVVSTGDILDMRNNNIEYEFIQGKMVDLDNKHKQLYRKYMQKYGE